MQQRLKFLKQAKKHKKGETDSSSSFPILVILIDELFNLVLLQKKSTGLYFLQLLIVGYEVNMHIVAASASTYRNLLIQLVNLHSKIEQQLNNNKLIGNRAIVKPLGAEMIITLDNLIFFKTIDTHTYELYFPI